MNEKPESLCMQLRRLADSAGEEIDAKRLCAAADEIDRLRRENEDLKSFCKGIASNIAAMLRPIGGDA